MGGVISDVRSQNGEWPYFETDEKMSLILHGTFLTAEIGRLWLTLLRTAGDKMVELYGVWDGIDDVFTRPPEAHESISVHRLLDSDFRFKEGGFYKVYLDN